MNIIKNTLRPLLNAAPGLRNIYHHTRGVLAATWHGFPSNKMIVIGITGTNGKTTVANLLANILETSGAKVGLATTINVWTGKRKFVNETKMTTLSPFALQGLLRKMADNGCKFAIVETTSHALEQHRVWGIFYDIAIFTNLTHDHLDYHRTLENYQKAKGKLFASLMDGLRKPNMPKTAIINLDDPAHTYFSGFPADQKLFFAIDKVDTAQTPDTLISANNIQVGVSGSSFTLTSPKGQTNINLKLAGRFNVSNALAATTAALVLGIDLPNIKRGLESVLQIPGRMEHVPNDKQLNIIIDYAHTPDGFQKVLESLKPLATNKLIVVFGAAGNRDTAKRPILGQIASQFADIIVLTEEDPGTENPADIINQIMPGIDTDKFHQNDNLHIIIDRKAAVQTALSIARPDDTVLLLAIGAQTVMIKNGKKVPYQERAVIEQALQNMP